MFSRLHIVIVLILTFFLTQNLWGEEPEKRKHRIDVGAVLYNIVSADTVYTHLYKFSLMGGVNLGYAYLGDGVRHRVSLNGGAGRLLSPYTSDPEYPSLSDLVFQFVFDYRVSFPVWETDTLKLWIGPGLYFFGNGWIPDNEYDILRYAWNLHSGVGFFSELDWVVADRHQLNFNLYLPILGIAWRPPYSGYTLQEEAILEEDGMLATIFSNPNFISFHNMFSLDLGIAYLYTISELIDLNIKYLFGVGYITIPRERIDIQNNFSIQISFKL